METRKERALRETLARAMRALQLHIEREQRLAEYLASLCVQVGRYVDQVGDLVEKTYDGEIKDKWAEVTVALGETMIMIGEIESVARKREREEGREK